MLGFYNLNCMEVLPKLKDGEFELAIVDPPYGDGNGGSIDRFGERFDRYIGESKKAMQGGGRWGKYGKKMAFWDEAPPKEYFDELFRVAKKVIIWGGNYYQLPSARNFIVWKKPNIPEKFSMAMAEYAWTNIQGNAKVFEYPSTRDNTSGGFHPTEKPIALYKWLLMNYAEPGDKILDTHVGSASSLIACEEMGFKYLGMEIDEEYYRKAKERLDAFNAQIRFF